MDEVQKTIKLHGKKVLDSLNVHWRFRLGECSFVHKDHDAAPDAKLHRGIATVGAVDWDTLEKKFADLEGQLITAKVDLNICFIYFFLLNLCFRCNLFLMSRKRKS